MPDSIQPSDVRPGDVLLHMGRGEISKLIAWASDSSYSHAAWVLDAETVAESVSVGVRKTPFAARAVDATDFSLIDVLRFGGQQGGLDAAALKALQARAERFMGAQYPLDELFELGVVCALRSKLDWPEWARWLLRIALDHVIQTDPARMVCSEFIYRCFAEADTAPPGRLRPRIEVLDSPPTPFPHINWIALWEEYEAARGRSANRALPAAPSQNMARDLATPASAAEPSAPDAAIADRAAQVRERRAALYPPAARGLNAVREIEDPWPNPATITPADLANSPSFGMLGRLLQSA